VALTCQATQDNVSQADAAVMFDTPKTGITVSANQPTMVSIP
jgi:hypothetical protein